ncbi:nuclease-related domain-containing protein [Nocardioides sp. GCM10028917]|uniref:nuclease-related domain-containing protein n=1 Tax=Nocardioides sp. GCM10028917 TaxID=3273408 RepID=UPI003618D953
MSAGESAYDVARRQREQAARLERSAALWEQGAAGEVAVATALAALPAGWVVLHDLAWPGRQRANLDHVVIGPGGVFVVDAKN